MYSEYEPKLSISSSDIVSLGFSETNVFNSSKDLKTSVFSSG